MNVIGYYVDWIFFFFKKKTAYEMRISDWSSDVCSSDLIVDAAIIERAGDVPAHVRLRDDFASIAETVFQKLGFAPHRAEILGRPRRPIGRASCRERGCQYV